MASINDRFMDFQVAQQIRWIRLANREVREALKILNRVDAQIAEAIQRADIESGRFTEARLLALRAQITELINAIHSRELSPALMESIRETSIAAAEIEEQALVRLLPAGLDVTTPNLGVLQAAASLRPFNGAVMADWIDQLRVSDLQRTWRAILDGITSGTTNADLIRQLLGTRALGYKDGVREVTRRGLQALVRTSINHATNTGRQIVWEANQDIIGSVRWVSTLDTRTSPICQFRDGKVGPVVAGTDWTPPDGAEVLDPPMARPPAHPNCRSTTVAVIKSWRELGFDVDEMPEGTRASMDGQVPSNLTYYDWLKRQSEAVQKDVLGPARFDMWKKEGIAPERFVNDQGRLLTLKELRKQSSLAFDPPATNRVVSRDPVFLGTHFTNSEAAAEIRRSGFDFDASSARTWQGSGLYMFEGDVKQQGNFGAHKISIKHNATRTFEGSTSEIERQVSKLKKSLVPPVFKLPDGSTVPGPDGAPLRLWNEDYSENAALRRAWIEAGYDSLRDTEAGVFALFDPEKIVEITLDGKPIKTRTRRL